MVMTESAQSSEKKLVYQPSGVSSWRKDASSYLFWTGRSAYSTVSGGPSTRVVVHVVLVSQSDTRFTRVLFTSSISLR
jgi:hypothetical protein